MRALPIIIVLLHLVFAVGVLGLASEAQTTKPAPRIGVLRAGSSPDPFVEAFRRGLQELGYVEGRNIVLEYRWAKGRDEQLPSLAADLVRLKVDVIVLSGPPALLAANQATADVPIVMAAIGDPVGLGVVRSLARPGANVTGLAYQNTELAGKWVQLLKEAVPSVTRVAALVDYAGGGQQVRTAEGAAQSVGVRLQVVKVDRSGDFAAAFAEAKKSKAEALIVLGSPFFSTYRARLVELAAQHRLPTMYHQSEFVVGSGGLMSSARIFMTYFGAPRPMWTRSSRAQSPAIFPSSSRASSSSSST